MSIKHGKRKTVDTFEFGVAKSVFDGVVSVELERLYEGVVVLIGIRADKLLADKEHG